MVVVSVTKGLHPISFNSSTNVLTIMGRRYPTLYASPMCVLTATMSPGFSLSSHPEYSSSWRPLMAVDSKNLFALASMNQTFDGAIAFLLSLPLILSIDPRLLLVVS